MYNTNNVFESGIQINCLIGVLLEQQKNINNIVARDSGDNE